jgi:hypothetical protein
MKAREEIADVIKWADRKGLENITAAVRAPSIFWTPRAADSPDRITAVRLISE